MARFFFHVTDGDERIADAEGWHLGALSEAGKRGCHALAEMIGEAIRTGRREHCIRIDIANENGVVLTRLEGRCVVTVSSPSGADTLSVRGSGADKGC
jgi:hypothetical protein